MMVIEWRGVGSELMGMPMIEITALSPRLDFLGTEVMYF